MIKIFFYFFIYYMIYVNSKITKQIQNIYYLIDYRYAQNIRCSFNDFYKYGYKNKLSGKLIKFSNLPCIAPRSDYGMKSGRQSDIPFSVCLLDIDFSIIYKNRFLSCNYLDGQH